VCGLIGCNTISPAQQSGGLETPSLTLPAHAVQATAVAVSFSPFGALGRGAGVAAGGALARGPASGAKVVSPPRPGQVLLGGHDNPMRSMVLEGHGTTLPGHFTVPEGTYLQIPASNILPESAGQQAAIRGTLGSGSLLIPPGGRAPNLVLHPPTPDMVIRSSSTTVTRPTLLKDILGPDMGFCVWGACR
jgi:hypothetical protein